MADTPDKQTLDELKRRLFDGISKAFDGLGSGGGSGTFDGYKDDNYYQRRLDDINKQREKLGNNPFDLAQKRKLYEQKKSLLSEQKHGYDKRGAMTQMISKIGSTAASSIDKYGTAIIGLSKARQMAELNMIRASYTKQADTLKAQLTNLNTQINKSLGSGLGILTKSANEAAYDSGRAVQEIAKSNLKTRLDIINISKKAELEISQAKLEKFTAEREFQNQLISGIGGAAQSIGSLFGPVGSMIGGALNIATSVATLTNKREIMQRQMEVEKMKLANEQYKQASDIATQQLETMEGWVGPFRDFIMKIDKFTGKFDTATHKFAATIGYNGERGREFAEYYRSAAVAVAKTFGASAEEVQKLQESYMSASTRAVNLSIDDMLNTMSVSRLFGMSPTESGQLFGEMNIFNTSISDGSDMMGKMYSTITKMGLSTSKFGKELVNNLKLAQEYNFKGGVENMMRLTKWAQQTRFNIQSATSFADKLVNGSLSDVLETSAKLQVLGGSAAMFSDPLAMMYEAGADVGALAKRQAAMFSDITGTFNSKTGETEFNWYENKLLTERAKAAGLNPEDVKNQIRQTNKQSVIDKQLKGMGLSDEDKLAIGNRATYNSKANRWEVTDIHGNTHDVREYGKNGGADIKDLLPADNDEAMLQVAQKSLGVEEEMQYLQEHILASLSKEQFADYEKNTRERMAIQKETYLDDSKNINIIAEKIRNFDTESMQVISDNLKQLIGNGSEALDDYFKTALNNAGIDEARMKGISEAMHIIKTKGLAYYTQQVAANISGEMTEDQYKEQKEKEGGTVKTKTDYADSEHDNRKDKKLKASNGLALNFEDTQKYLKENYGFEVEDQAEFNRYDYFRGKDGKIYRRKVSNHKDRQNDPNERYNTTGFDYIKVLGDDGKWKAVSVSGDLGLGADSSLVNKKAEELGLKQIADGYGATNGGMILGASNVKSIRDGAVNVKTSIRDQYLAAESGGPIDILLKQILPGLMMLVNNSKGNSNPNNISLNLGGEIKLSQDGASINLVEIMRNDPSVASQFIRLFKRAEQINASGKPTNNFMV